MVGNSFKQTQNHDELAFDSRSICLTLRSRVFVCTQMSYMSLNPQSYPKSCFSYGWKTARAVVPLFEYGVWVGWGGAITFMLLAISSDATLGLRHGLGFGLWVGRGGVGWGNAVHVTCNNVHYANTPMMKTPEETSKFMIWEASS